MANVIGIAQLKNQVLFKKVSDLEYGDPIAILYFKEAIDEYRRLKDVESLVLGLIASMKAGDTDLSDPWFDEAMSKVAEMSHKLFGAFIICLYNKFDIDRLKVLYDRVIEDDETINTLTCAFLDIESYMQKWNFTGTAVCLDSFLKNDEDILFFNGCIDILKKQFQNKVFAVTYDCPPDEDEFGITFHVNTQATNRSKILDETIKRLDAWCEKNEKPYSAVPFYLAVRSFNSLGTLFR